MAASRFQWSMPRRGDVLGTWRLEGTLEEGGNAFVRRLLSHNAIKITALSS
jgi:hypothetical protein